MIREINVNGLNVQYELSENNLKIYDSYLYRKKSTMNEILDEIQKAHLESDIWKQRSRFGMICEWRVHNWFFNNFWYVQHTKDVDLEFPQKFYYKIAYFVASLFY